jgi:hypothetical protein
MDDLIKRLHQGKSCYVGTPAGQLSAADELGILCLEAAAALSEARAEVERLRGEVVAGSTSLEAAQRQVDEMRTALEMCQQLGSATVRRIARAALEAKHG